MKKYYVDVNGLNYVYTEKEEAYKFAQEKGYKVYERQEWKIYMAFIPSGSGFKSGYYTMTAGSLQTAIESNIKTIIKGLSMSGVAGYHIHKAQIVRRGGKAELVLNVSPLGKLEKECEPVEKIVEIVGFEANDINGDVVDLLK